MSTMRGQRRAAVTILLAALATTGVAGCGAATDQQTEKPPLTGSSVRSSVAVHALTSTVVAHALTRPKAHAHQPAGGPLPERRHQTVAADTATITATTPAPGSAHGAPAHHRPAVPLTTAVGTDPGKTTLPRQRIAARAVKAAVSRSAHPLIEQTITLPRRSPAEHAGGPVSKAAKRLHGNGTRSTTGGRGRSAPAEHGKSSHQPNEAARGTAVDLSTINPCTYVRRTQVAAALRVASVDARDAPLGPTCVFTARDRTKIATLSVQVGTLPGDLRRMRRPVTIRIAGRSAYCGTLGQPLLLVKLSHYYVLSVAAPCRAARAVARAALRHIRA